VLVSAAVAAKPSASTVDTEVALLWSFVATIAAECLLALFLWYTQKGF